jgi:hypothetical protein
MFSSHRHMKTTPYRPWAVWLALCIALLGALAPTLSHAMNWARGDQAPLIEICTSVGPRWMALSNGFEPVPSDPATTAVLDHCPFCLLMADRMAPPPQSLSLSFAAYGHAGVLAPPPKVVLPAQVLAAAHPRGPPVL